MRDRGRLPCPEPGEKRSGLVARAHVDMAGSAGSREVQGPPHDRRTDSVALHLGRDDDPAEGHAAGFMRLEPEGPDYLVAEQAALVSDVGGAEEQFVVCPLV